MTEVKAKEGLARTEPARRMSTQAFGLALITASFAVVLAGFLIFPGGGEAGIAVVIVAFGALVTWMVWKVAKLWAVIVGLVVTVVALMAFFTAFGIFQPFSPVEFISGLLYLFGFFFALVGGIMALKRERRAAGVGQTGLLMRKAAVGLVGVLAVVSLIGFVTTRTSVSAAEAGNAAVIDMANFVFDPVSPTVTAGQDLLLTNSDGFVHDFTIDELDIFASFGPGSEGLVDLSDVPAGTYPFFCSLHSDGESGMAGTLTIEG